MAGFSNKSIFGILSDTLKKMSNIGMEYEDMVVRQSKAIGVTEAQFGNEGFIPEELKYSLSLADIGSSKFVAYFDKEYKSKRENLRKFSMNSEIEFILDIISDETIVYDSANYFCEINVQKLKPIIKEDKVDEVLTDIDVEFKRLYTLFNFNQGHDAWNYFRQFLVDGFLAFEIIYDESGTNIIGFKELDPVSLRPGIEKDENGKYQKYWVQYDENPQMKRVLPDSSIIYISYAKGNFTSRVSYVERLVRALNLLRLMENSRIIWNIMNSSFRLKMVVPISTKSTQKAKESLSEYRSIYKEDISLNYESGELTVNGQPSMQFFKNYIVPSKNGEQPEISVIGGEGYDLSDTDVINYFKNKLKEESKIPFERFDFQGGGGSFSASPDGMSREEIRFAKFINRLRSIFQEIILKPLYIQLCLKYEEFANDELFKSTLSLDFIKDNYFEEQKSFAVLQSRVDVVNSLMGIMTKTKDATGMDVDVPYFHPEFLIEKYLKLSTEELKQNKTMKEKKEIEDLEYMKKQQELMGDDGMGM
jgi:hypothetical protein